MIKRVHGNYEIDFKKEYIYIKYSGMCNVELAKKFYEEFISRVKGRNFTNLKVLVDCLEFDGATPDSYTFSSKVNNWLNSNDLIAKAIITREAIIVKLVEYRDNELRKQNIEVFDNIKDGEEWLLNQ